MSKAKCKNCGDIVESISRHHLSTCWCYDKSTKLMSEWDEKHPEADAKAKQVYYQSVAHGFYLDGGKEYCRVGGNFEDIEWMDDK